MKLIFKVLAYLNKLLLPSMTKNRLDLNKVSKFQMVLIGWRTFVTKRALD
ncbi:MAG: SsrA-binding protein [Flavobacteriaceae bacterium]|nr:SsrA-binding protein [Flavobacteriaceae bacterium]